MRYSATKALKKILKLKKRLKIIQGGSSAGKTIAILLLLIDRAQREKGKIFSVVSETMPHLRKGALRDFLSIMEAHNYYNESRFNKTENIYTFETGTKIEFFSADQPGKVRGPRRSVLFINEANNVPFETFTQLSIRTNEDIYIDYNPVAEFWVHTDVIPNQDHDFVILTYKDNEALPETIVQEIESRRGNEQFWRVYGQGLLGEVEGKIYKNWKIINEIPHEAQLIRRGLDFGYTNDPSVAVNTYRYNGGYIFDEIFAQKGMSNKQISDQLLLEHREILVIADSAEPKSIDELRIYGVNVTGATKGRGSVLHGIQYLQSVPIWVTKRSVAVIKAYRNYMWRQDRLTGKFLNEPLHDFSDAMDACRYSVDSLYTDRGQVPKRRKRHIKTTKYG